MREILFALGNVCSEFDWYISDVETNIGNFNEGWYSGEELEKVLNSKEIQFIWAVFSAFPIGHRQPITASPFVDNNPYYWNGSEINPQINSAQFEIACWDSSATILVGLNESQIKNFLNKYPDAVELKSVAR